MLRVKILFITLIMAVSFIANCQNLSYKEFDNIPLGKIATASNCFIEDEDGLMWIGTNTGLYYYDGYSVTQLKSTDVNLNIQIYTGFCDKSLLYLGTEKGLLIYDCSTDKYIKPALNFPADIRALALKDEMLWIGSINGFYCYDIKAKTLTDLSKGLPHSTVYSIQPTIEGDFYIGTYNGLSRYNPANKQFVEIKLIHNNKRSNIFVNSLIEDKKNGLIWIGTEGALLKYDKRTGVVENIATLRDNSIKSLAFDSDNNLFIGTDNGVYKYDGKLFKHYVHDSRITTTLSNNIVWSVHVDKNNNLWAGTDYNISFSPNANNIKSIHISDLTGVNDGNVFYSILKDSRGFTWLGGANGLIRYNPIDNNSIWYSIGNAKYPLVHNRIRDIYEDSNRNLWIATDGSINHYDYKSEQFIHHTITNKDNTLNANWAYNIFEDKNNDLWVSTFLGGIFIINRDDLLQSRENGYRSLGSSPLTRASVVIQMIQAKDGGAWATFKGEGLHKVDASKQTRKKILLNNDTFNPSFIVEDDRGNVWGAFRGGIAEISSSGELIKTHALNQFIDSDIFAMCQVKDNLWLTTSDGVWIINIKNKGVRRLPIPNRLFASIFYDNETESVILGGVDEILNVSSSITDQENKDNKIHLTGIYVNDRPYKDTRSSVRDVEHISLSYNENHVVVEVSDLVYSKDSRCRFMYIMNGLDKEWMMLPENSNKISYANMQPGEYTLIVKRLDDNDKTNAGVRSIKITINAPWYYSTVAKVIYALLFVALIAWIINFFRVKNKLKIERLDRERSMAHVKTRMDFFTNVSHEFKTPLSMILAPVGKMLPEVKDPSILKNLNIIRQNAMRLNNLIHQALEFNRIDMEGENLLIFSKLELVEFCKSIVEAYRETCPTKNFIFNSIIDSLYIELDVVKIESVINNIISNACKYSEDNATIVFSLEIKGEIVEINISDDGVGIPEAEIPFVFQRLYQSSRTVDNNDGTGIGLYLAKTYIELHRGSISLAANAGGGTVVSINIPLPQNGVKDEHCRGKELSYIDNSRPTILIVEDNVAIAEFLKENFSNEYNCLVANNGKAGLAVCGSIVPELIIVDFMMPIMDGIEMCKRLKKNGILSNIPIIMLTAKDDVATEAETVKLGIDLFMSKPFDMNLLTSRAKQLINKKELIRSKIRIEEITSTVNKIEAESSDEKLLAEIIKVIEDNITNSELNVNYVCEKTGLGSKQLYRKIKQHIGITPVEYIKQIRIKKAALLIQQNKFTISEVMYMVGFSSSSYFSKCFQSQFGKTPKEYSEEVNK